MKLPAISPHCLRILATVCCWLSLVSLTHATHIERVVREANPSNTIWMISTRHLEYPDWQATAHVELKLLRFDPTGDQWVDGTLEQFLGEETDQTMTVFYVPGNRTEWDEAFDKGWAFYHALASDTGTPNFRFVIWSWPSDQISGPIRDVRAKACRTNSDGHYLGWLLSQMCPDAQVSLAGFSFGARIITGALHLLGGGMLTGQTLPSATLSRSPMRAVLMAAAVHNDWLLPGRPHGEVWPLTDELSILYNSSDPVLKRYRFVDPHARPAALGYIGFWCADEVGSAADRVSPRDVCCQVGRTHDFGCYLGSVEIMESVRQTMLWKPTTRNQ